MLPCGGMAKRNASGQFVKGRGKARRSTSSAITRTARAAPVTVVRVAAPAKVKRRTIHRRAASSALNFLGGSKSGHRTAIVIGSAALGYASKEGWLQKLPVVGKAGPITSFGLLGWGAEQILHVKLPAIVTDMITSALALSAFNLGFSGGQTLVGQDAYQMPGGAVFFD